MATHGFQYAQQTVQAGPRLTAPPAPSSGTRAHGTPKVPSRDWRDEGACVGQPAVLWYANEPSSEANGTAMYREGKRICESCPVQHECLEWALDTKEAFGLWGGVTPRGRSKLLRERDLSPLRARNARSGGSLRGRR